MATNLHGIPGTSMPTLYSLQQNIPMMISNYIIKLLGIDDKDSDAAKLICQFILLVTVGAVMANINHLFDFIKTTLQKTGLFLWKQVLFFVFSKKKSKEEQKFEKEYASFRFIHLPYQKMDDVDPHYIAWIHFIHSQIVADTTHRMKLDTLEPANNPGRPNIFPKVSLPKRDLFFEIAFFAKPDNDEKRTPFVLEHNPQGTIKIYGKRTRETLSMDGTIKSNQSAENANEILGSSSSSSQDETKEEKKGPLGSAEKKSHKYDVDIDVLTVYIEGKHNLHTLIEINQSVLQWNEFRTANKSTITTQDVNQIEFFTTRAFEQIWFKEKPKFMAAYEEFMTGVDLYKQRGDPWTFSVLLYGPPGCGKTSLIKAMAKDSVRRQRTCDIVVVSPKNVKTRRDFQQIFNASFQNRFIVVEDFDCSEWGNIFKSRDFYAKNKKKEGDLDSGEIEILKSALEADVQDKHITKTLQTPAEVSEFQKLRDYFLAAEKRKETEKSQYFTKSDSFNILDGLVERVGQRAVWTTNVPNPYEVFDPAFLRRFELVIELTYCDHEGIQYLLEKYYNTPVPLLPGKPTFQESYPTIPTMTFSPCKIKQFCKESSSISDCLFKLSSFSSFSF